MSSIRDIFGIDLRTLALFRIGLGLVILADIAILLPDLTAFFTDSGVLPRWEAATYNHWARISILMSGGSLGFQIAMFAIGTVSALCLVLGYRSRLAAVVSWLFLLSVTNRNLIIIQGGDNLITLLAFWGMFLPLGARFSIDAAMRTNPARETNRYFSAATVGLLLQAMAVYFFGALIKDGPQWLGEGTAVYYALHLDSFATPLAHWFRQFGNLLTVLTYYVWYLELLAPLIMFSPVLHVPLRVVGLILLVTMHVGFHLLLEIGLFAFISIVSLSAFVPGQVWDWIGRRFASVQRRSITLYYDQGCEFCRKTCSILKVFCLPSDVRILPAQSDPEIGAILDERFTWVVTDAEGNRHTHWGAVLFVLAQNPLFRPFAWIGRIPPLLWLGNRIYDWIGRNRSTLGSLTGWLLVERPMTLRTPGIVNLIVSVFVLLWFVINLTTLPGVSYKLQGPLLVASKALNLEQNWRLFAPYPAHVDGWFVIPGKLGDGTEVDVFKRTPGRPSEARPDIVYDVFDSYRWRKYINRIARDAYEPQLRNYARYLCRSWNADREGDRRLHTFTIIYMQDRTLPAYAGNETTRREIAHWRCYDKSV